MAEEKTYVFGEPSGSTDPATLLAAMNNNGGFGNGSWIWIIFLFFLYGWRGNGFGNGFGGDGSSNGYGVDLLMQAINGNGNAIGQLATTLNSDINSVQTAINSVQSSIQSVGSQVGLTGTQVINAIQAGNCQLASQLSQCCCENKLLITNQGYENRIANLEQTNFLGDKIDALSTSIADHFCDLEKREMQSKIDSLLEEKNTLQTNISQANQTAQIQAYIASTVNPLASDVASLKCRLPETVSVPYSPVTAIPSCVAYNYGLNGFNPFLNNGSIWS